MIFGQRIFTRRKSSNLILVDTPANIATIEVITIVPPCRGEPVLVRQKKKGLFSKTITFIVKYLESSTVIYTPHCV
jgi:hypothetical protein